MKITNIKSSTVLIETSKSKILFDPWLFDGEYYGSWYHYPKLEIKENFFNKIDYIYISHIHPDHMSKKSLSYLSKEIPILINNYSAKFLKLNLENLGFRVIELSDGDKFEFEKNQFITIYSADNCNPVLCNKYFGCGKIETVLGSTQIDSFCIIEADDKKILNLNDCPFELTKEAIKKNILPFHAIDFLLLGYSGAGAFPQSFILEKKLKIELANRKCNNFLNQALNFINLINPKYFMPFAGTYYLGGSLSKLNKYRGVPEIDFALDFLNKNKKSKHCKGVLLNSYSSFDLSINRPSNDYVKINIDDRSKYLKKISNNLFDYQKEIFPSKLDLKKLILKGYNNFELKRKNLKVSLKSKIAICFFENCFLFDFIGGKPIFIKKVELSSLKEDLIIYSLDERLLYKILLGPKYAHWNNAEIGSHILFERIPEKYNREIYYCMNYFHS